MNTVEREQQRAQKATLRRTVLRRREMQPNKAVVSGSICATLERLPEYRQARTICSYVGVGSEVLTWNLLRAAIAGGKQVIVPYVDGSRLLLFHLYDLAELAPAPFALLEPCPELRGQSDRRVQPAEVELFVVPGLAFDPTGARLGYGKRYYDNLLRSAPSESPRIGLAFACQMEPRLPVLIYDVSMHVIVTEKVVHRCHAVS